ncbi:MAG: NAD-dependent epimerase/dehydratase family protein [Ignavibacteria bacterium]|nr:NAD-dependent epimerase/dehydratase family protein [Ignavibacteria bacterium]
MNILILGGTIFLGKHIVNAALNKNHNVTLFNRGKHNPEWFPDIEKIKGDREGDLSELKGRKFDAVIDTCGYVPKIVKRSAEYLRDAAGHYSFISSISVYNEFKELNMNEESPTGVVTDGNVDEMTMENYGPLKALCEKEVTDVFGADASIVRSGLIVGDGDFSDRFTYWVRKIANGGKVIIPVSKVNNVQFIDVKDLAEWTLKMAEEKTSGVYNSTGPLEPLSLNDFAAKCKDFSGSDAEFIYMDEKFLLDENVVPFRDLTLWLPEEDAGVNNINISKAKHAGLSIRPLEDTLKDTIEYDLSRGPDFKLRTGLSEEREKELLEKWEKLK